MRRVAAIGLRARTGRAIAVVLAESDDGPLVVRREELQTWDPEVPDSHRPHHVGLELPGDEAARAVASCERVVKATARGAFARLVGAVASDAMKVVGVGVVGAPAKDRSQLLKIGNEHVRAHAAEGQLFRAVLEQAARSKRLACLTLSDRAGFEEACARMSCAEASLRHEVDALGKAVGPPWRADEKLACAAALAVLSGRSTGGGGR